MFPSTTYSQSERVIWISQPPWPTRITQAAPPCRQPHTTILQPQRRRWYLATQQSGAVLRFGAVLRSGGVPRFGEAPPSGAVLQFGAAVVRKGSRQFGEALPSGDQQLSPRPFPYPLAANSRTSRSAT